MNQTLKISIVRGGCRFATPLYLGASYVLSFDGQRADEAATVLFVKPTSKTPEKTTGIEGLAQSVTDAGTGAITLALNKTVLVDWFTDNLACDVDACVDAHCYVFNSAGEVIADSPVTIEYRPVDFVVDATGFSQYTQLLTRIVALEDNRALDVGRIAQNEAAIDALEEEDASIREDVAESILAQAQTTLIQAKAYADLIRQMVAKLVYVRDVDASTADLDKYRKIEVGTVVVGNKTEIVLKISSELYTLEGGDEDTNRYVYNDTSNTFTGDTGVVNTFNTNVAFGAGYTVLLNNTPSADDNSKNVVNSEWVVAKIDSAWNTHKDAFMSAANSWSGVQTFTNGIVGNVTGNVKGNVTGNVTGDVTGGVTVPAENTLVAAGAETHGGTETHTGAEMHSGEENHTGAVTLANVVAQEVAGSGCLPSASNMISTKGINEKYVWDVLGMVIGFLGGYYKVLTSNPVAYALNGGTAHDSDINTASWREHDRQAGMFGIGVTTLETGCMKGGNSLYRIVFPNATEVKEGAFKWNHELYTAVLPSCKKIGDNAFYCPSADGRSAYELRAISAIAVEEIGAFAFACNHALGNINSDTDALQNLYTDETGIVKTGTIYFPKCEKIGQYAFYNAGGHYYNPATSHLRYIKLPECRYVGDHAFYHDTGYLYNAYKEVEIGNKKVDGAYVVPLGTYNESTLEDTRNTIGAYALNEANDTTNGPLVKVDCPRTQVFKAYCFYNNTYINELNIECAEVVEEYAFAAVGALVTDTTTYADRGFNLPNCKTVGNHAFSMYNADRYNIWQWLNAPLLETAGVAAFMQNCNLKKVYCPSLVTMAESAFNRCYNLSKSMDENGDELDYLEFPNVTSVGQYAFYNDSGIVTLKMNKAAAIGYQAFYGCGNLTNLHLEDVSSDVILAQIGNWALNTNCRVHASGGSTIAYVNLSWHVI